MARPKVVIVGAGFGGLAAAKALRNTPANILLIDRTNHHLFQPLLYQVATSVLTPSQIATPIRGILRKQKNTTVILGEVTGVDKDQKCVFVSDADRQNVPIPYDYLILATGSTHSYFGHNEFEQFAPGLKSLADAEAARNKILQAFELAEAEDDPARHRDLLTFVLVGAGPTGVEMAGALAVFVQTSLKSEFRRIDPVQPALCWSIWHLEFSAPFLKTSPKPPRHASKNWALRSGLDTALITSMRTASSSPVNGSSAKRLSGPPALRPPLQVSGSTWKPIEQDEFACSLT